MTCGGCAVYPCDNSGGHLKTDKACDRFKPTENSKMDMEELKALNMKNAVEDNKVDDVKQLVKEVNSKVIAQTIIDNLKYVRNEMEHNYSGLSDIEQEAICKALLKEVGLDAREAKSICNELDKGNGKKKDDDDEVYPYSQCAYDVMNNKHILFLHETQEYYVYHRGYYKRLGTRNTVQPLRKVIRSFCMQKANWEASTAYITETLSLIEDKVVTNSKDMKFDGKICLLNGVFDLETMKLLPHDPKYKFFNQIPVKYDADAKCPEITKFMDDILSEQVYKDTMYEFMGYCLTPEFKIQKAIFNIGEGANGKSTLIKLIDKFIGIDNSSHISLHKLDSDAYAAADLHNKLVNMFPDLSSNKLQDIDVFKMVTSDTDRIRARRIYGHPFEFYNHAKLMFSANKLPDVPSDNYAFFRRAIPIPFYANFQGREDRTLMDRMTTEEELSGLLNVCLYHLKRLIERGRYSYNPSVDDVKRLYRINSNPVQQYAEDCLKYVEDNMVEKNVVYANYCMWCESLKIVPVKNNVFGREMKEMSYITARPDGDKRFYINVAIRGKETIQGNFNISNPLGVELL